MKYILELSTMMGDGLGEEQWSVFESNTPLPVPNVGDSIELQGNQFAAEVVNRVMRVFGDNEVTIHFQVFCREISE